MATIKRSWDMLSKEAKNHSIKKLIDFFQTERDEEIGIIAAENLLDHFLQTAGMQIYNQGVMDSIGFVKERFENLELDMESLIRET